MKKLCLFLIAQLSLYNMMAQEPAPLVQPVKLGDNVSVKFGGFARVDYFMDSRKGKDNVDGLFYLWPEVIKKDGNGKDLNDRANQNLSATATRFSALFTGPDVMKAKSTAYFEFDFTGGSSNYTNFRQGWVKLEWPKLSLQIGRTWHPLQGPVTPSSVGLSFEAPFNVFCRGEQIRLNYKAGKFNFLAATFFQSGHTSFGPNASTGESEQNLRFMRNAMFPDLNFQIHFTAGGFTTGILAEYKKLLPREYTTLASVNYKSDEKIGSGALALFGQYKSGNLVIKGNTMYGQNLAEMAMQGGYAIKSIDALTGNEKYTSSCSHTTWLNVVYGEKVKYALFAGFEKNLGFKDELNSTVYKFYGRGDNIRNMYRLAPSVSYYTGRMIFQAEGEYTSVAYGNMDYADHGKVKNTYQVDNKRIYLSVSFLF